MSDDELGDVDYLHAGQVRQLLAERVNAVAYGMTDRVAELDKQLAEFGYVAPEKVEKVARDEPPQDRRAAHERTEKAAEIADGPPASGRRTPGKSRA